MNTYCNKRRYGNNKQLKNGFRDVKISSVYTPSLVDDFMFEEHADSSFTFTSDITMLFNQKRLDKLSLQSLISHFDDIQQKNDSLRELRSKLSDSQLSQLIKSRYIQTPSELIAYSEYLVSQTSHLDAELKQVIQNTESKVDKADTSETSVTV